MDGTIYFSYIVAPFWSDIDTRLKGRVHYQSYASGDSVASDDRLQIVSQFISSEMGVEFNGSWMLLATWEDVHPFPHGVSEQLGRLNPYLESVS